MSALVEVCQKRGWNPPAYITEPCKGAGFLLKVNCTFLAGFSVDTSFLQVEVQGKCYLPDSSSDTKKGAKALAAQHCLEELGLLPKAST